MTDETYELRDFSLPPTLKQKISQTEYKILISSQKRRKFARLEKKYKELHRLTGLFVNRYADELVTMGIEDPITADPKPYTNLLKKLKKERLQQRRFFRLRDRAIRRNKVWDAEHKFWIRRKALYEDQLK